jgi:hypothetical protein
MSARRYLGNSSAVLVNFIADVSGDPHNLFAKNAR